MNDDMKVFLIVHVIWWFILALLFHDEHLGIPEISNLMGLVKFNLVSLFLLFFPYILIYHIIGALGGWVFLVGSFMEKPKETFLASYFVLLWGGSFLLVLQDENKDLLRDKEQSIQNEKFWNETKSDLNKQISEHLSLIEELEKQNTQHLSKIEELERVKTKKTRRKKRSRTKQADALSKKPVSKDICEIAWEAGARCYVYEVSGNLAKCQLSSQYHSDNRYCSLAIAEEFQENLEHITSNGKTFAIDKNGYWYNSSIFSEKIKVDLVKIWEIKKSE